MNNDLSEYKIGDRVPAPYFFGVAPPGISKSHYDDPFSSEGWFAHCQDAARRLGIREGSMLGDSQAPRWKLALRALSEMLRSPSTAYRLLTHGSVCPSHLLPVAAMIHDIHLRYGRVAVLDIGGGFGDNFFQLLRVLKRESIADLEYRIVDNHRSCSLGRELYRHFRIKPVFLTDHNDLPKNNDIILLIGTLQYIGSWTSAVASISQLASRYLYVARTPISANQSFTTTQLVCPAYGKMAGRNLGSTPINVLGLEELRAAVPEEWRQMFEFMETRYSQQFARLPAPFRDVAYVNLGWQRSTI